MTIISQLAVALAQLTPAQQPAADSSGVAQNAGQTTVVWLVALLLLAALLLVAFKRSKRTHLD